MINPLTRLLGLFIVLGQMILINFFFCKSIQYVTIILYESHTVLQYGHAGKYAYFRCILFNQYKILPVIYIHGIHFHDFTFLLKYM